MYFESTDRSDENLDAYFTSGYRQKGSQSSEKKRFEINFFVRQNASNFAIFIEKETPRSFFLFSISSNFEFYLMNAGAFIR